MTSIYSWNVNGIRAAQKKGFLEWLYTVKPDILCIQETKAWREQLDTALVEPKVYKTYWAEAAKKGYSGTAIYSKKEPLDVVVGVPKELIDSQLKDKYGDTSDEGRVITAEYDDYFVSTVYTPNAKDDLSRIPMRQAWDPMYLAYMQQLEAKKPVIFCGDLNVAHTADDLARPKENEGKKGFTKEERSGFEAYLQAGYVDTFRMFTDGNGHYTYWSNWGGARQRNVGWRIDYVMVSPQLRNSVSKAEIHAEVTGSDHCPVSVHLS